MTEKQIKTLADIRNLIRTSKFSELDALIKKNRSKVFVFGYYRAADNKIHFTYSYKDAEGNKIDKLEKY